MPSIRRRALAPEVCRPIKEIGSAEVKQLDELLVAAQMGFAIGTTRPWLGRIAECEEVANLVGYLASDLAHFINGTMIEIDGGQQKPLMDRFRDR